MDEEEEYDMRTSDHVAQAMIRDLELEYEEGGHIPKADLSPRLLWLASSVVHCTGRIERRARLTRLMACALAWAVHEEMEARK